MRLYQYIHIYIYIYIFESLSFLPTLLHSNERQYFIERLLIILKCAGKHKKLQNIKLKKTVYQKTMRKNKSANNDDFFLMCCLPVKMK